ncbi:MAG: flagellar assembly protein FliW [Fibrobacterales bacterium]
MDTKTYTIDDTVFTEDQLIIFHNGLPGFQQLKKFVITTTKEYEPFHFLQSIDEPGIKFVIVNPMLFKPDYDPAMNKAHIADLELQSKEELLFYVIVTLHKDMSQSTANLTGPVLINIKKQIGKQLILDDGRYSVAEPILGGGA